MKTKQKEPKHSYSSTGTYATCPQQYYKVNWLRVPEYQSTDNEANIRGSLIHDHIEHCVLEDEPYTLPDELHPEQDYNWILDDFRSLTGLKIPEMQLAIDKQWKPCDYKDPRAWYRGKVDLTCIKGTHMNVKDLKSGKRKFYVAEDYTRWLQSRHTGGRKPTKEDTRWLSDPTDTVLANARQASEYALMMFLHFPKVETIDFSFVWSNVEGVTEDVYQFELERDKEQLFKTMLHLPTKINESIETDTWPLVKSGLCKGWCSVVSCKNWKPKEQRF